VVEAERIWPDTNLYPMRRQSNVVNENQAKDKEALQNEDGMLLINF